MAWTSPSVSPQGHTGQFLCFRRITVLDNEAKGQRQGRGLLPKGKSPIVPFSPRPAAPDVQEREREREGGVGVKRTGMNDHLP